MKKLLSLVLAAAMLLSLVPAAFAEEAETKSINGKEYGVDYTSLYSQFGKDTTIADVTEDEETGLCYIEKDGVEYELGLDFLSMAMVYNTRSSTAGIPKTMCTRPGGATTCSAGTT